jgi:chitinase
MRKSVGIILGAVLCANIGLTDLAFSQSKPWVTAYHPTWWYGALTPSMIDFNSLTHIIIFPAQDASSSAPYFNSAGIDDGKDFPQILSLAHAKGVKVIISVVGGYGQTNMPVVAADAAKCQAFVDAACAYVKSKGADGIELDWEFPRAGDKVGWNRLISLFRQQLDTWTPRGILMTSMYYSVGGADDGPYQVGPMVAAFDQINPMTYTMWMGGGGGPYHAGFDTPVNLPTQFSGYVGYSLSNPRKGGPLSYIDAGYPASKVGIAISFEGTRFGGVSTLGPQYSNWAFVSSVTKSLSSGYPNIPTSGRSWDPVAQANYCVSGSNVYSFQDTNSVKAIASWAKQQGFGGIMIYDLGPGYDLALSVPDAMLKMAARVMLNGVVNPVGATGTFTADNPSLPEGGGTVQLSWTSAHAVSASIDQGIGTVPLSGTISVSVTTSTTFHLTLTDSSGTPVVLSTSVTVAVPTAPTGTFSVSPTSLQSGGGPVTLTWTSTGATIASIDQGIGTVSTSGSIKDTVTATTTYHLILTNAAGSKSYSATVTVQAPSPDAPTGTFSLSPEVLPYGGGEVTLSWASSGAVSARINRGVGTVPLSGSVKDSVTSTLRYTLTLTGSTGLTSSYTARVSVASSPKNVSGVFKAHPPTLPPKGGSVNLSWSSINATSARIDPGIGTVPVSGSLDINQVSASTTFLLTLSNDSSEQVYAADVVLEPSGSFIASPSLLPLGGGHVTLTWSSDNATSATLDHGIGSVPLTGSHSVNVTSSTAFTLTLSNSAFSEAFVESVLVSDVPGSTEPKDYGLEQNYPNPFNPSTNIVFNLPADSYVKLAVYDLLGQRVVSLVDGFKPKNRYVIPFSSEGLAAGIYFYTLTAGDYIETRKMAIIK